jgi:hypothetical protein
MRSDRRLDSLCRRRLIPISPTPHFDLGTLSAHPQTKHRWSRVRRRFADWLAPAGSSTRPSVNTAQRAPRGGAEAVNQREAPTRIGLLRSTPVTKLRGSWFVLVRRRTPPPHAACQACDAPTARAAPAGACAYLMLSIDGAVISIGRCCPRWLCCRAGIRCQP